MRKPVLSCREKYEMTKFCIGDECETQWGNFVLLFGTEQSLHTHLSEDN